MPDEMARRVGYRLKLAQNALRVAMDETLAGLGVTAPQYAVLSAVAIDPGISNAALARAAFVTPQTMQGVIANLEKAGLLARTPDPHHGRIKRAALTGRGKSVLKRAHDRVVAVESAMLSGLKPEEVERLGLALQACAENLRAARGSPPQGR